MLFIEKHGKEKKRKNVKNIFESENNCIFLYIFNDINKYTVSIKHKGDL